jgi:hypothetical protein
MRDGRMSTTDDIQRLAEWTHRNLDAVHDFFHHSRTVWTSLQILVDGGHALVSENVATGNTLDQHGLLRVAPQYTKDYLATFTFRQFVSTFEVFLFDLLYRLLLHNPWQFARSQVDFEIVLKARNREEIISAMILKKLNDLKYENIRDWFDALNKALNLGCPTDDEIDTLAEVKASRDVLEHNAGVVNEIYTRKAGKRARYAVGQQIEIDDSYHLESWRLIKKVVGDTTTAAIARIASSTTPAG